MLTDNGSQFVSKPMKELCKLLQISQVTTSPYHPQGNGTIERMQKTLKSILCKSVDENKDWVTQLPYAMFALRNMPLSDHGFTPFARQS